MFQAGSEDGKSEAPPFCITVSLWEEGGAQRPSEIEGHQAGIKHWKKDLPEILSLHFEGELCKLDSVLWKGILDVSCLFVIW